MLAGADISARFALDVGSVENLRREARADPQQGLRAAASQFEALFVQMMLKSMRDAVGSGGLFDSQDTKLYTAMLDQQLSVALAKRGVGLAEIMTRQLERAGATSSVSEAPAVPRAPGAAPPAVSVPPLSVPEAKPAATEIPRTAREFVGRLWPHAVEAGRATGIAPHFILGQAALESGWGRAEIRHADGSPSHNLFGIKAGRGWSGPTADVVTTEYVNGAPVKTVERFRAYGSYAEAFNDYAKLLVNSPRYAQVLNERSDPAAFARGLQQAGYATDPHYADKLTRVITGSVMRAGLTG